jgi:hypothetical protein
MAEDVFNPERFRWTGSPEIKTPLPHRQRESASYFVPSLPQGLFDQLAALPGKSLAVYLVLAQQVKIRRRRKVLLTNARLGLCGIDRKAKQRALKNLAAEGFIHVEWRERKNPRVYLLDTPGQPGST